VRWSSIRILSVGAVRAMVARPEPPRKDSRRPRQKGIRTLDDRPTDNARPRLTGHSPDVRPELRELLFNGLVAPIDVIDALDVGNTLCDETSKHEARGRT